MSRPLAWLLGLLGLALLTFLCVRLHTPGIERDLQNRTTAALDDQGFTGTGVAVSGRDLTLKGGVPTESARAAALQAAREVPGVRTVSDELRVVGGSVASEAALFSLRNGSEGTLVARGTVPDVAARTSLVDRIQAAFPDRVIDDELAVGPGGAGWQTSVEALLPALSGVQDLGVAVEPAPVATAGMDGSMVVVSGRVPSEAAKADLESAAAAAVRAPYQFRSALTVGDEPAPSAGADSPTGASGPDAATLQAAETALREATSGDPVAFELATADLTASSMGTLRDVAEVLTRFASVRVEIQGHTDDEDSSEHNLQLSQERAEAVWAYLIGQGITADRMEARGYGEDRPIATNETAEGRALNRRVVFQVLR